MIAALGHRHPYGQGVPIRPLAVRAGPDDLSVGAAMTIDDARTGLLVGRELATALVDGGYDCLIAAHRRVPFIVDGVIALAALCVADRLGPGVAKLAIAGHRSVEPAAGPALDHLGLRPLLDLDLGGGGGDRGLSRLPTGGRGGARPRRDR